MKMARGYVRVSTKGSKDRGTDKAQTSKLKKKAARDGVKLVKIYRDLAVTGTMKFEDRPEGKKLLADLKQGEEIWAVHFDRLTREDSREDWFRVFELLKAKQVPFDPVDGTRIDPTDEHADLNWLLSGKSARSEYQRVINRFNDGRKEAKKKRNHYAEGGIPYGVFYHNIRTNELEEVIPVKKFKPHPEEYKVLKEFFKLVKAGYALEWIAEEFNNRGIPTKHGKKWYGQTLGHILKNDYYYTGILIHKVETEYDEKGKKVTKELDEKDWIRVDTKVRLFSKAEVMEVRRCRETHPSTKRKKTRANEAKYPPGYKPTSGADVLRMWASYDPFQQWILL
jgi:DNA invertase Pin-like site-specific DNA recombinase